MKNKILIIILLTLSVVTFSGCHWFIPGAIKRETSLIKVDVTTCLMEIEQIEKDKSKTLTNRRKEVIEKAKRTLNRIKPHLENLDNYTQGKKATR